MPDIHHNFIIKSKADKVFEAFCTPAGLDSWWTLRSAGKPQMGDIYTFYFGPEYDWRAEVTLSRPNKALTWRMKDAMKDWMGTQVGFQLTERKDETSVAFFHKGWAEANEHFGITTYCWAMLLKGLKDYVEQGIVIPHALRN